MANIIGTHMTEGQLITRPPRFFGSNYNNWKVRMRIFIQANDYACWNVIENGAIIPTKITEKGEVPKPQDEWTFLDVNDVQNNVKAIHTLYCALDMNEFNRISGCETTKEIWDKLEVTHEGKNQVKESKISMLVHKYELFKLKINKIIFEMFTITWISYVYEITLKSNEEINESKKKRKISFKTYSSQNKWSHTWWWRNDIVH